MNIFNYIFYRVSNLYTKTGLETSSPEIYSNGIVSLLQNLNITTIFYLIFKEKITTPYYIFFLYATIFILNGIFILNKKNLQKFEEKWGNENIKKRRLNGILIVVYMLCSILLFIIALSS